MTTELQCKGDYHTGSDAAWRHGCRHPEAVAAHRQWLTDHGGSGRQVPPAVDDDGNCVAVRHGTQGAYFKAGCRHPEALAAYEKYQARRKSAEQRKRDREQIMLWSQDARRAKRMTGGRLSYDPRRIWRRGNMAVDRNNLLMLMHGFVDSPTMGEKLAAMNRLAGTMVAGESWCEKAHPITKTEKAERLGISLTGLSALRRTQLRMIESRHLRRLADVQWRVAVAAHSAGRKDQERLDHERAHAQRAARTEIYEQRRELRRLTIEREQARRG